jgi:peptide/nickel transport system substrate-binding protein
MDTYEKLDQLVKSGQITRRDFIVRATALGASVALSPLLSSQTAYATPQKGGRFRIGMAGGSTSDGLDPALMTDHMLITLSWQIRNCLVEIDHNAKPIPELAESWESNDNATRWIFNLRKGVEFHNGKTLTAEDVVFSLNRHRSQDSKSVAKAYFNSVTDLKTEGKYRIIVDLEKGNADFPYFMSDSHAAIIPAGTTNFDDGIGTGGYILENFNAGVRSLVKRNPNYWKEGRAHFDEIEILSVADNTARTNALQTKTVDAMNRCDLKTADLFKRQPGINVIRTTGSKHYTFPMRTDLAPFDNNDVRLALKYAINREELLKIVLRGYGSIGNDTPIGPTYQYFAKDIPQRSYDPDKAKFHFKKAGLSNHTFTIHASEAAFSGGVEAALLYSEHARLAGINIKIVRAPKDGYWKSIWMKKPWSMSYYSGKPTENWMFTQAYSIESKWNETFWQNKRFNNLLVEARSETKDEKRREMYRDMQYILWSEGGTIIPMFADFVDAVNDKVGYGNLAGNFALDGFRCSERWWFKR